MIFRLIQIDNFMKSKIGLYTEGEDELPVVVLSMLEVSFSLVASVISNY